MLPEMSMIQECGAKRVQNALRHLAIASCGMTIQMSTYDVIVLTHDQNLNCL